MTIIRSNRRISRTIQNEQKADTMKYLQACLLKKQVDPAIEKLTRTITGPGATDAAQTRLEVTYVSCKQHLTKLCADELDSKIWKTWRVVPPLWHGIGMWMTLTQMRMTGS